MLAQRIPAALILALALLAAPAARADVDSFTVDSGGDGFDVNLGDEVCDADPGAGVACTLRAAAVEANDNDGLGETDVIAFHASMRNEQIQLSSPIDTIDEPLAINGCSMDLNHAGPCVGVRGDSLGEDVFLLVAGASPVTFRGLAITNAGRAIAALTFTQGLTVKNNWFGIQIDGDDEAIGTGVSVTADGAVIGGPGGAGGASPADRNVFANATRGLEIFVGDEAVVQGNWFGVDETGSAAAPNGDGIVVAGNGSDPAAGTLIGGTQPAPGACSGPCNLISGSADGIDLRGSFSQAAEATTIQGNFIGLNAGGTAAIGNTVGIRSNDAGGTLVGGDAAGERNYISGGGDAISATDANGVDNLTVQNNFVGLSPSGTSALGRPQLSGISVGTTAGQTATISGNRISVGDEAFAINASGEDVDVRGNVVGIGVGGQALGGGEVGINASALTEGTIADNTVGNTAGTAVLVDSTLNSTFTGNRIGTNPDDTGSHPVGGAGFELDDNLAAVDGNVIGGATAADENLIRHTAGSAILLRPADGGGVDGNGILRNRGSSSEIFIDLGGDGPGNTGVSAPHSGVQPPAVNGATGSVIRGTAAANAVVEVFTTPDAGSPHELTAFVGSATASASGQWELGAALAHGTRLTALQTPSTVIGSSELSSARAVDAQAPQTTITRGPRKRVRVKRNARRARVVFRFASSEPGSFQCQLDRRPFVPCNTGSFRRRVGRGRHSFRVRAIDSAGNVDGSPAVRRFRVVRKRRR